MKARYVKPDDILKGHSKQVREIVRSLRTIIKEVVPDAKELGYPVWRAIGYRHPASGYFCGIFPLKDSVKLYFENGILLPDEGKLLQGNGKKTRYLEFKNKGDIEPGTIRWFLLNAVNLNA